MGSGLCVTTTFPDAFPLPVREPNHSTFIADRQRNIYICSGGAELTSTGHRSEFRHGGDPCTVLAIVSMNHEVLPLPSRPGPSSRRGGKQSHSRAVVPILPAERRRTAQNPQCSAGDSSSCGYRNRFIFSFLETARGPLWARDLSRFCGSLWR